MQMEIHAIYRVETSDNAAMAELCRSLSQLATLTHETGAPGDASVGALVAPSQQPTLQTLQQGTTVSPEVLKARRQQQAADARAAKVAKQPTQQAAPNAQNSATQQDLLGAGTNGNGADAGTTDDDDLGLGENASSMSPAEARDAGLALVREVYSAGHVAEVKQLQKTLSVAKFYDVPVDSGHAFYARVMKLAQSVGLRQ
jgi:hypothetical protein